MNPLCVQWVASGEACI